MNKIFLIIQREYITRVRKRSFIIMSVLGPVLFAAFLAVPAWLATMEDKEIKTIAVVDSSNIFNGILPETEYIKFVYPQEANLKILQDNFKNGGYSAILFIPQDILSSNTPFLYSDKGSVLSTEMHIENALEKEIENIKLKEKNIENLDEILKSAETHINLRSITLTGDGKQKESHTGIAMGIGYGGGMLIYFFIFLFGAQVMRGVIEEKTNRIVEVIVSSVKPFQLMMGKIIGIGLTGLTQFLLWIILTVAFVTFTQKAFFPGTDGGQIQKTEIQNIISNESPSPVADLNSSKGDLRITEEIFSSLGDIDFFMILGSFLFFFIAGYLLYASLFAIIGAAVDNEADTQQFMLPVTLPLILAIFVMINAINNPDGDLAFWFSLIPFTSPVVMMVRIPFHPALWQVILSGLILVITFIATTWMAGKLYRTGILMYGKKVTYKELGRWLRYKS